MLCKTCDYALGAAVDIKQIFYSDCKISVKQAVTNIHINTWREYMDSEMYFQILFYVVTASFYFGVGRWC
jgi:hypothetical protein